MTDPEGALEHALGVLRRRKLVFILACVGVPLIAFLVSSSKPTEYTATATLLFQSNETNTLEPAREVATNEVLAGLPVVAEKTAKAIGPSVTAAQVLGSVTAGSSNSMANVATVSATTESPQLSARISNAYSHAYIDFRREAEQSQVQKAVDLVERSLEALSPAERAGAQGQTLADRLNRLKVQQALQTGKTELVQPAGVPTSPSSPRTKRNVLIGVVLGVLLGAALIALLERVDRRIRSVEELEELLGIPLIGRIPRSKLLDGPDPLDVVRAPEAEAFRILRSNLRYFNVDQQRRSILIASAEPGEGKSTVARGLAIVMASMGDSVVLVEADLRKEHDIHKVTGSPTKGLSNVLLDTPLDSALVQVDVSPPGQADERALTILPSGPIPPNPSELLEGDRMQAAMDSLQDRFETVVVDSPALGVVGDAMILAPLVTQIVAVGRVGKATRDDARRFAQQISFVDKQVVGVVATFTDFERKKYDYYHRSGTAGGLRWGTPGGAGRR